MSRGLINRLEKIEHRTPSFTGWDYRNDAYWRLDEAERANIDRLMREHRTGSRDAMSSVDLCTLDEFMHDCGAYL